MRLTLARSPRSSSTPEVSTDAAKSGRSDEPIPLRAALPALGKTDRERGIVFDALAKYKDAWTSGDPNVIAKFQQTTDPRRVAALSDYLAKYPIQDVRFNEIRICGTHGRDIYARFNLIHTFPAPDGSIARHEAACWKRFRAEKGAVTMHDLPDRSERSPAQRT